MRFDDWKPFYDAIRADFGYSLDADKRSARFLDDRFGGFDTDRIDRLLRGEKVAVVGDAPSLEPSRLPDDTVVIAADAATERLTEAGVSADVVVTDLDGAPRLAAELSSESVVAVHAHGDNRDALERWLPEFEKENVVGTTQTCPFGSLHNFGGFTDGDRAAYLADAFGASTIELYGFDFDAATGEKRRKLRWARRLLRVLAEKRDEKLV